MKNALIYLLLILPVLFVACSDDDKDLDPELDFKVPVLTKENTVSFTVDLFNLKSVSFIADGSQYAIDWGDGTIEKYVSSINESSYRYKKSGKYTIKIWSENITKLNISVGLLDITTDLSIGNCPNLVDAGIGCFHDISHISFENCPKLEYLNLGSCNELKTIDISKCLSLKHLQCYSNEKMTTIDISKNKLLEEVSIANMALSSLDLSQNPEIRSLDCSINKLSSLSVANNKKLGNLSCSENQLTELILPESIWSLDCSDNNLKTIDVSKLSGLNSLACSSNQLTDLEISNNTALRGIKCDRNEIAELDLSNNPLISIIYCEKNNLDAEALNKIFTDLPKWERKGTSSQPNQIMFFDNPGEADCDEKLITDKGWVISKEE